MKFIENIEEAQNKLLLGHMGLQKIHIRGLKS